MKTKSNLLSLIVLVHVLAGLLASTMLFPGCARTPTTVTRLPGYGAGNTPGATAVVENSHLWVAPSYTGNSARNTGPVPALPYSREELWIIARGSEGVTQGAEDAPGSGALMAKLEGREVPMPLKHTDVRASISGYIGAVEVTQQFHNPYSQKIEAVYVFPLPHDAAINEFIMTIGERRIRGIIRERKEAEQIYQAAKQHGLVASLLTEERPNVFTQSVANIEPGKEIGVNI